MGVIPALRRSPWVEFLGGTTRSTATATQVLSSEEIHYPTYESLLADPNVDAVYLPLPNDLHLAYLEKALLAGKHVLCEKPMFLADSDYAQLEHLLANTDRLVTEAFMSSYHPRLRAALSQVSSGMFGAVVSIETTFAGTLIPLGGYRLDSTRGGGSLLDVGIYALYPIVSLLGAEPYQIWTHAAWSQGEHPVDLTMRALLAYEGDAGAHFTTSFVTGESQALRILTREATIEMDRTCTPGVDDTTWTVATAGEVVTYEAVGRDPYQAMVDEVFEAFSHGCEPTWNLAESRKLARLLLRINELAQSSLTQT
ncbi:Gfo/Idh/MocA family oxidoreductase [Ferrimicrobium sp.]|uniref:Gfo/Idh/MocA family protein n=1 Tax=Ferrimicrobium sp. TaxID=2926050 RepID=UPI002615B15F|nr:Gfo/Idh/MocA family oxidoreductase [Ferrimicrobium sp.]